MISLRIILKNRFCDTPIFIVVLIMFEWGFFKPKRKLKSHSISIRWNNIAFPIESKCSDYNGIVYIIY